MKYTVIILNRTIQGEKYWFVHLDRESVVQAEDDASDSVRKALWSSGYHVSEDELDTIGVFEGIQIDKYQSSDSTVLVP